MTPSEHLTEILQGGIDDAMDIDTNSATWARQSARFLTQEVLDPNGVNLNLLLQALDDYVDLQRDGNVDPAGRTSASDVMFYANRLEALFQPEPTS